MNGSALSVDTPTGVVPMSLEASASGTGVVDEVANIDATVLSDPNYCAEYAEDVYAALRENETRTAPLPNYMAAQRDITPAMRAILMDWLVEVAEEYRLKSETLFLTINYIDRFLSKRNVKRCKLQLVGVAAMLVASKFEEIYPPLVKDFVFITDNTYSRAQVIQMETIILQTLKFELVVSTPLPFLVRYARAVDDLPDEILSLARYYCECTIHSYDFLKYPPSLTAAASLCLALSTRGWNYWSPSLSYYSGFTSDDLQACILDLTGVLANEPSAQLQGVWEKYSHSKWHRVSRSRIWTTGDFVPFATDTNPSSRSASRPTQSGHRHTASLPPAIFR
ncbi:G2/mitotic-specific cyclin-A [Thecamonas trahens ATCC 50062]|uniref:G2/mitotic-specific cyclin-A n=1 Tax=Thecamonas trahens ATCC 50062 TaxID=461836 RepID=A0A0L0D6S2_THETB|nr:G2/mitotic-specific cyclin-A [Thecamonas trahens ATCC 50062]KNC47791.1 G2/mitotic-specific cyclin-A [Thecamonas trahens ATCC 50062]|eukprot:XP_013759269.1 G2/mitotic-specific cyclin-A [Thecamonas trahens ATCC 50062]